MLVKTGRGGSAWRQKEKPSSEIEGERERKFLLSSLPVTCLSNLGHQEKVKRERERERERNIYWREEEEEKRREEVVEEKKKKKK